MKVLFLGQNPSSTNVDQNVAFVGSRSYQTLVRWLSVLDLKLEDVILVNASRKLGKVVLADADVAGILKILGAQERPVKVVCLGHYATSVYLMLRRDQIVPELTYSLPHPSGLNRKLNNKEAVIKTLMSCKAALNRDTYQQALDKYEAPNFILMR